MTGTAMAKNYSIDLHVHSSFSDGRLDPMALAARAAFNNVSAVAVTDHDTFDGHEQKAAACRKAGVELVPGLELSCEFSGREAHVLCLFVDTESPWMGRLSELRAARENRMVGMLERLADMGIRLTLDDIPANGGVYGRPHLARAMVAKGVVKSVNEAFARFLYDDGPAYVAKMRLPFAEGVDLAKRLGAVAVVAHPGISGLLGSLDDLRRMGIDGIEAYHPKHGGETLASLLRYCRDRGMLVSGGSDFHAPGESPDIGSQRVPRELLEPLREAAAKAG